MMVSLCGGSLVSARGGMLLSFVAVIFAFAEPPRLALHQ